MTYSRGRLLVTVLVLLGCVGAMAQSVATSTPFAAGMSAGDWIQIGLLLAAASGFWVTLKVKQDVLATGQAEIEDSHETLKLEFRQHLSWATEKADEMTAKSDERYVRQDLLSAHLQRIDERLSGIERYLYNGTRKGNGA